jgi:hypothetical protein
MRLAVLLLALAALAAGCADEQSEQASSALSEATALEIKIWPSGENSETTEYSLICVKEDEATPEEANPLPDATNACRRLLQLENPFEPLPLDVACTQIYGGPQVAEVRGTFEGRRIKARFSRADGCQIDRWDRHRFLFPIRT